MSLIPIDSGMSWGAKYFHHASDDLLGLLNVHHVKITRGRGGKLTKIRLSVSAIITAGWSLARR